MGGFELNGNDIAIRYSAQDKTLLVEGKGLPGSEKKTFSDVQASKSEIGTTMTVVLLESSRNGTRVLLHLLVPNIKQPDQNLSITGAAMVVSDFSNVIGTVPHVLQAYDVRPLTGTIQASQ